MSTINPHFTIEYSQPEEYRFSHDSVFLARWVYEHLERRGFDPTAGTLMDLCAGCGVIGIDHMVHWLREKGKVFHQAYFVEVQSIYESHFLENSDRASLPTEMHFITKNYEQLFVPEWSRQVDILLCNPPYFFVGQGKLSPSEFKNRCRFYIDSDFSFLMRSIGHLLRPRGEAFVLLRDQKDHGWSPLNEARKIFGSSAQLDVVGDIRGTDVVKITSLRS